MRAEFSCTKLAFTGEPAGRLWGDEEEEEAKKVSREGSGVGNLVFLV